MEAGQRMYKRDKTVSAIPSWFVMDSKYRRRYPLAFRRPGISPKKWKTRDFMTKASSLDELAAHMRDRSRRASCHGRAFQRIRAEGERRGLPPWRR